MKAIFSDGGPLFNTNSLITISILTLIFIILIAWAIYHGLLLFKNQKKSLYIAKRNIKYLKSISLFALVLGVFDQLLGLYSIFSAIKEAGDINESIVYQGIETSMIPLLYAISIYLSSIIIWLILDFILSKKLNE